MTRNARIRLFVLCVVCLMIVPVVAAAQTPGHDADRPPVAQAVSLPGATPVTRDVEDQILDPWPSSWLPESAPVSPPAGEGPAVPPPDDRAAGGHQDEGDWGRVTYHAYDRDRGQYDLFVMRGLQAGQGSNRLTNDAAVDFQPALSPDGTRLAFVSAPARSDGTFEDLEIYVASFNYVTGSMGPPTRLTDNDTNDYWPVWSPDGKR
ncbi:MAG TPA: hypothetical protein PLR07_14700, partial [Promineifilum sp.]|nr:hypothetical protein [Promineifilum sp.]